MMLLMTSPLCVLCAQDEAREGKRNLTEVPLHTCMCPPCFTESFKDGKMECTPKCDLSECDDLSGVCRGAAGSSGAPPDPAKP